MASMKSSLLVLLVCLCLKSAQGATYDQDLGSNRNAGAQSTHKTAIKPQAVQSDANLIMHCNVTGEVQEFALLDLSRRLFC